MSLIPKKIFQSWKTKNLPPKIQENVQKIKELNPEYEYHLFDDNDCRELLRTYFGNNYANAFDELIPGAFKCDFWRYAVMYVYGGVYLDMDITPLVPFRDMLTDKDEFVSIVDITHFSTPGIYQAFIASRPLHDIMRYSLQLAFANIITKRSDMLGVDTLSITGPGVVLVATNLFLEKTDTTECVKPGRYGSVVLFKMDPNFTYDLNGQKIFKNKFTGYKPTSNYCFSKTFKNDPKKTLRKNLKIICILIMVSILVLIIMVYFWRKKSINCEKSCSQV